MPISGLTQVADFSPQLSSQALSITGPFPPLIKVQMDETGLVITAEIRQECSPLTQLHICSSLTVNSSFAEQFQSSKEQETQSVQKVRVISIPVSSLDWLPKEPGTGLEHSQEHNHSLQQLICPGCWCWTSAPHDTPHNPLQQDHRHFPRLFPSQSYILTLQRGRLGICPVKGSVIILLDLKCSGVEGSCSYCPHSHGAVREKWVVTDLWHCYLAWKSAVYP